MELGTDVETEAVVVDLVEGLLDSCAVFFGEDSAVDEEFEAAVGPGSATEGSVGVDGELGVFLFVFDHYCGVDRVYIVHDTRMFVIHSQSPIIMYSRIIRHSLNHPQSISISIESALTTHIMSMNIQSNFLANLTQRHPSKEQINLNLLILQLISMQYDLRIVVHIILRQRYIYHML